jgi:hypothetical protein
MMSDYEQILITGGGRIACKRCQARSGRTKRQCGKPALKGKRVCGHHGGYSSGPKTKEGIERIRQAHLKHGEFSREAVQKASESDAVFRYMVDIGNHVSLFVKKIKIVGRPSSLYERLDLTDPLQVLEAIARTKRKS